MGSAVHPDRRGRTLFQSAVATQAAARATHVDLSLGFVLTQTTVDADGIAGRLNAFERTVVALTRQWRRDPVLAPVRELRMSPETLAALLHWLEGDEHPNPRTVARLAVYACGALTEPGVSDGWVRVLL